MLSISPRPRTARETVLRSPALAPSTALLATKPENSAGLILPNHTEENRHRAANVIRTGPTAPAAKARVHQLAFPPFRSRTPRRRMQRPGTSKSRATTNMNPGVPTTSAPALLV